MRKAILYGSDALMARRAAGAGMDKQGELMKNWKTSAEKILTTGPVVPVIVVNKLEHAVPMAKALVAGGVRVLEVTLRTPVAMEALRLMIKEVPDAIVGAGTVINTQQLQEVTEAGAQFVISPGITEPLLKAAVEGPVPLIPGISTVSELMTGMDYGLREFKFFPAEANGGVKALQAIGGPFPQVRFCPTGGISPANYRDYLALKSVLCIGGSWLVPNDALESGDWDRITRLAREAVEGAK
jgi:2-dehydro-3-deoxyphosphogluconate aldolase/(4S)-4-hydroxy-2-oxoglutarate aldolase